MSRERAIIEQQIRGHQEAIDKAKEELKSLDRIRVPEGIRFTDHGKECMGLVFNGQKQAIGYHVDGETWMVEALGKGEWDVLDAPLYLEPCKREDLKPGDWAYRCHTSKPTFVNPDQYSLILGRKDYAKISYNLNVGVHSDRYSHWYKVVE